MLAVPAMEYSSSQDVQPCNSMAVQLQVQLAAEEEETSCASYYAYSMRQLRIPACCFADDCTAGNNCQLPAAAVCCHDS